MWSGLAPLFPGDPNAKEKRKKRKEKGRKKKKKGRKEKKKGRKEKEDVFPLSRCHCKETLWMTRTAQLSTALHVKAWHGTAGHGTALHSPRLAPALRGRASSPSPCEVFSDETVLEGKMSKGTINLSAPLAGIFYCWGVREGKILYINIYK